MIMFKFRLFMNIQLVVNAVQYAAASEILHLGQLLSVIGSVSFRTFERVIFIGFPRYYVQIGEKKKKYIGKLE